LKHIHDRKIIHRDLKAENIFMTTKGVAKIGDLGVCKVCNTDSTGARTEIGTPIIMSPE
jgi:serine/threonine protein kinase